MGIFRSNDAARFAAPAPEPVDEPTVELSPQPDEVAAWKAARLADLDAQLAEIAVIPPPVRAQWQWHRLDRLLDQRNAVAGEPSSAEVELRPSVPVIPGRPT